jgi:hypothetical protein
VFLFEFHFLLLAVFPLGLILQFSFDECEQVVSSLQEAGMGEYKFAGFPP